MTYKRQICRTCAYWDSNAARDAAGRIRSDRAARCRFPVGRFMPSSVMSVSRIHTGFMPADGGVACPVWSNDGSLVPRNGSGYTAAMVAQEPEHDGQADEENSRAS